MRQYPAGAPPPARHDRRLSYEAMRPHPDRQRSAPVLSPSDEPRRSSWIATLHRSHATPPASQRVAVLPTLHEFRAIHPPAPPDRLIPLAGSPPPRDRCLNVRLAMLVTPTMRRRQPKELDSIE